eukprot:TRINITY_DN95812_c0_g1_i1.p1 TRINITY_DN95812_c0_g1~~TRINITY_DN95812_c0_g1_i1.p1  ORF type:complete len:397 (-),score=42.93 TRINITY_DN95812_c0_g1_i1:36-1226(-)
MHFFAVVRHEDRADSLDAAFVCGKHWCKTDDFTKWPLDPPLSDSGLSKAAEVGHRLRELSDECGSRVNIVLSSPYHRCIQTASAIRQVLGPDTPLLVDLSLGEVFGPCVLGESKPNLPCVRFQDGSSKQPRFKTAGSWPVWPESINSARQRFANRFLRYLNRSLGKCRNFVIVTHADAVAAALCVMPSMIGDIQCIQPGGLVFARRQHAQARVVEAEAESPMSARIDLPEDEWTLTMHGISAKTLKPDRLAAQRTVTRLVSGLQDSPFGQTSQGVQDLSAATWSFLLESGVGASGLGSAYGHPEMGSPLATSRMPPARNCHIQHMLDHIDEVNRAMRSSVQESDTKAKHIQPLHDAENEQQRSSSRSVELSLSSSLFARRNLQSKCPEREEIVVRV